MRRIDTNTWRVTEPISILIGKPALRPSDEMIEALRYAVAPSGATTIYWFWMSLPPDVPHLGLGVAPDDDMIVKRIGTSVEPIWKRLSPENPLFDILRLGQSDIDQIIVKEGELLFGDPLARN